MHAAISGTRRTVVGHGEIPTQNSIFSRPRFIDMVIENQSAFSNYRIALNRCVNTRRKPLLPLLPSKSLFLMTSWIQSVTSFLVTNRVNSLFTLVGWLYSFQFYFVVFFRPVCLLLSHYLHSIKKLRTVIFFKLKQTNGTSHRFNYFLTLNL